MGDLGEEMGYPVEALGVVAGGEEGVEGDGGARGAEAVHVEEGLDCLVRHAGAAVGEDEGGKEGFLGDLRVGFLGFDEGGDVGEAAGFGKAANGEVEGVAGGDGGGEAGGEGGVDGEGFVGVVLGLELGFLGGDGGGRRRRRRREGEAADVEEEDKVARGGGRRWREETHSFSSVWIGGNVKGGGFCRVLWG